MGVCINRYVGQHEKTQQQPMEEDSDKRQQAESRKPQPSSSRPSSSSMISSFSAAGSNYDKLCLSLLSGLPNEQELALNVCAILSNEGSYMLQLEQAPRLVDLLIAQTGVWRLDDESTKLMHLENWHGLEGRRMCQFWQSTLDFKYDTLLQLLGFSIGEYETYGDLFNLESDLGSLNAEGQRVLRIALILHNLSFEKNNVPVLVQSSSFLRFLLLSMNSSWSNLKQTAFDTFSNVASAVKLSIERDACTRLLFQAVTEGVQSYDRFMAIRSMDILSQLCDPNEDVIPSRLDVEVYQQLVFYLTAHDIMLLFYTLEALYALSDLGRYPCDRIACVHGSIGSLVSLLTIDPSQYGPSAQIRMKIVETLVPSESVGEQEEKAESVADTETASVATPTAAAATTTTTGNVDSETFACNWLKSTYEVSPGSVTSRNDIYADYVSFCGRAGRKGVLNANVFATCVKNSFPHCHLKKVTSGCGVVTFHHDGLKRKNVVTSLGVPPVSKVPPVATQKNPTTTTAVTPSKPPPKPVQSPILKAQLSAPATASPTPLLKTYSQSVVAAAKAVSSASPNSRGVTSTASSTLIKSLLANKVQQRNLQQSVPRMVIYSPAAGKMTALTSGIVGHSPTTTIVRCIRPGTLSQVRPSLQARIVPNKGCIITTPNSGVIKANPMWASKPHLVRQQQSLITTPTHHHQVQINGAQQIESQKEVHLDSEDSKNIALVSSVLLKQPNSISLENQFLSDSGIDTKDSSFSDGLSMRDNNSNQHILLSTTAQDGAVAYKIATPNELPTSSGNFFIVRSQPAAIPAPPVKEQQCEIALVNGSDAASTFSLSAPSLIQPKVISSTSNIMKSVLGELESTPCIAKHQMIQRESICRKAPLLNGLLDKGKLPLLEEFQSKTILLQNGEVAKSPSKPVQLSISQGTSPVACNSNSLISVSVHPDSISSSPSNSVFTISSNAISQGIFTVSSASSVSPLSLSSIASTVMPSPTSISAPISLNSIVIPAPSFNSVIIPASSLSSAIVHSSQSSTPSLNSTAITTSSVLVPSVLPATSFHSNGTDLMQICTGQTTFSGTVEVQPDQKGVVRLHIESPENSNQGSDLSSISDIARTLECASQAISRTNAECNTQVPFSSSACVAAPQTVTLINSNTPTLTTRTGQQIFVVTPVLNQPQLQLQSPNIKLCILQSFPKSEDLSSVDLVSIPQVNLNQLRHPPETSTLKRPSSETLCVATSVKKPRIDSPLLEASLRLPTASSAGAVVVDTKPRETMLETPLRLPTVSAGTVVVDTKPRETLLEASLRLPEASAASAIIVDTKPRETVLETSLRLPTAAAAGTVTIDTKPHETLPVLLKSSSISDNVPKTTTAIPVQNADLPCDKEIKTFSGLSSAGDNSPLVTATTTTTSSSSKLEFICEWKDCGLKFSSHGLVFLHVSRAHIPQGDEDAMCQWEGCDSMKRKRFSLLTHLQDWHCSERVLHAQAVRRLQLSQQGKTSVPPPQKPPPHPGYAPDAAMLAIKRHALQYINPKELSEEKESALTKSIRLTSALILRNLVTHSSVARTYVRRFEPELAYLAMSPVESARTIAQCLSELSRTHD